MTTELSLTVSRHLPFAPERVFDAWLDPETMRKFLVPGPGMTVPEATSDPRVGGRFRVVMQAPDMDECWPHEGEYLLIDRANRLRFTWVSGYTQDNSEVTLDLKPKGTGTDITLTHIRFPNQESRDNHEGGWTMILAALETAL
ncbi:SRPBCC family protein [Shimia abyssi]|uniref:Uncharacterized protein YndB with AHSA1/START domain n=1 Tax=Shimia abyssi TaxID=1662395 RepID=A0A2P8FFZ5_9RHOB|nr:SRPBCC domain-containing protein [Shimia abyssi]PSL20618.1 uncharacterized protein YndB with AHSA1/START domain [Shimia abyssi]